MLRQAKYIINTMTRFLRDESGGMITLTAFMLPMIFGFAGLGLDVTSWYMERRILQNMADMGAIDGAHTALTYQYEALPPKVADFLKTVDYDPATDVLEVYHPPVSGDYIGSDGFVEVILTRDVNMYMLSGFYALRGEDYNAIVAARAVAGMVPFGENCIVALDKHADQALLFSGNANVRANCGIHANSDSSSAIYVWGNARLSADPAQAAGGIEVREADNFESTNVSSGSATQVPDPFEGYDMLPPTEYGACDDETVGVAQGVYKGGGDPNDVINFAIPSVDADGAPEVDELGRQYYDLKPGRYCGGLNINISDIHLRLNKLDQYGMENGGAIPAPGNYIIDDGDFRANATAVVSGYEVTVFLTGEFPEDVGTINNINGDADLKLFAPTTGDYKGILFYQDEKATLDAATAEFNGGAEMQLEGALYFPNNEVSFSGNAESDPSCMVIVANTVDFTGTSVIENDFEKCEKYGLDEIMLMKRVELVE